MIEKIVLHKLNSILSKIKVATPSDVDIVTKIMIKLYEGTDFNLLYRENRELLSDKKQRVFLCADEEDVIIGFAHCSMRYEYVEGTSDGVKGYLEGIYVEKEYRSQGIGKALVDNCKFWCKENGAKEFASDCEINNVESYKFHMELGFEVANKIICFKQTI
ncbi:MAG: aminoglycoside 6'-N-acetyltransferase [Lachnospirales bacterium]